MTCYKNRVRDETTSRGKRSRSANKGAKHCYCKWLLLVRHEGEIESICSSKCTKRDVMEKRLLERAMIPEKCGKWLSDVIGEDDVQEIINQKCDKGM